MINERNKIPTKKKQREAVLYAERPDNDVGGLSDRDSSLTERPIIVRTLSGHGFAKHVVLIQREKAFSGSAVLAVVANAMENFQKYKVSDSNGPLDY